VPRPTPLWKLPRAEAYAARKARRQARKETAVSSKKEPSIGGIAADALRQFVDRIERLEEEKKALSDDIKDVYAQAKSQGFDPKTVRQIVKLRKLSQEERDEQEALLDIYKAALGMLADTPLGAAAVRRLSEPPAPKQPASQADPGQPDLEDFTGRADEAAADGVPTPVPPAEPEPTVDDARVAGRNAATAGKPVTANPFPARDPRRAAWDEAWCQASGSDGMDLPASWRRSSPKKPGKGDDKKAA